MKFYFWNQQSNSVFEFYCLLFDYHVKIQGKIKMLWKLKIQRQELKHRKQNFNLGELNILREGFLDILNLNI